MTEIPAIQAFIADCTPRERWLLLGLLATLLIAAAYLGLWQPLRTQNAALTDRIRQTERARVQVVALPPAPDTAAADTRPVAVVITEAAETFGLQIRRLQPQGGTVQVALDGPAAGQQDQGDGAPRYCRETPAAGRARQLAGRRH